MYILTATVQTDVSHPPQSVISGSLMTSFYPVVCEVPQSVVLSTDKQC